MKCNYHLVSLCKSYLSDESFYQAVLAWYKTDYEIDLEDEDIPYFIRFQGFCEITKRLHLLASRIKRFDNTSFLIETYSRANREPDTSNFWLICKLASFIRQTSVEDLREANLWSADIEEEIAKLSK
jgi:hypothetical protein